MATPTDLTPVRNARAAFQVARQELIAALDEVGTSAAALVEARRLYAPGQYELLAAIAASDAAVAAATAARALEKSRRTALHDAIKGWLTAVSLDQDLGRLSTRAPLVLFPVRVETRFDLAASPKVLRVRIYPDEIFLNLHETALTREEHAAAIDYYTRRDAGDPENELWRRIIQIMSPARAAYVLRRMTPTFDGGTSGTTSGGSPEPRFPTDVAFRPSDFTRPGESVLPDRWVVQVVRGRSAQTYLGNPIPEPLTMTADPQAKTTAELASFPGSNPPLPIDDEIAWTVDYARAESVGMAVTIPLTAEQAAVGTGGFDRLSVFGIKSTLDEAETTAALEQLFDAHHYTRGLAIVPQGAPTNNTEGAPTPIPASDPDGAISYGYERESPPMQNTSSQIVGLPNSDGTRLAGVLGIHSGTFANVAGTDGAEQVRALQMMTLLWPSTLGYVVNEIMQPVSQTPHTPPYHDLVRDYFLGNVRARGPAPAFRIGQVPYGVLPALSILGWEKRGTSTDETFEQSARDTLLRLRELWKGALAKVATVKANASDPLADLLQTLALHPSSRELAVRHASGEIVEYNLSWLLGFDFRASKVVAQANVAQQFKTIGQPGWQDSVLAGLVFAEQANQVAIPLVAPPESLAETAYLPPAFFEALTASSFSVADLLNDTLAVEPAVKNTVFYKLIRQSLLCALARKALQVVLANPSSGIIPALHELQLIGFGSGAQPTPYGKLLLTTPSFAGGKTLGDYVRPQVDEVFDTIEDEPGLKSASTAELDRLLSETLDLASHRLDAWLTAFATRRLGEMRAAQSASSVAAPVGNYLGGYALVENVRPVAHATSTLSGFGTVETQTGNGGFIQAPSRAHAAAAAILRNGYLSYRGENASNPTKYAIDLSSSRVRAAREILDALRAGQSVGAVFGYRFERGIEQNYPASLGVIPDRFALRKYYPLVANKAGGGTEVTPDKVPAVAGPNVVDGLALWRAFQANSIPFATAADLPRPGTARHNAIVAEIGKLGEIVDGVSDLIVAEGVLQLAHGNLSAASADLDSLARGSRPPESQMAISERGGIATSHRVAMLFTPGTTPTSPGPGWPAATPRAQAEPTLDSWVGTVLGNPSLVKAKVTLDPINPADAPGSLEITLASLGLRPLDLLAIARSPAAANAGSMLDRRITARAAAVMAAGGDISHTVGLIDYSVPAGQRSIPQVMEVARAIGALFGKARPLVSEDLATAADAPAARDSTEGSNLYLAATLTGLAMNAGNGLQTAAANLAAATTAVEITTALVAVANFVPDAFPAWGASLAALVASKAVVTAEVDRRIAAAGAAVSPSGTTAKAKTAQALARLRAVFGDDFLALPTIDPPNPAELDQSLRARTTLLPGASDGGAPTRFLQQASQVYEGLARLRTLSLYMGAFNAAPLRTDVAQLPYTPGERWVGLPFTSSNKPIPGRHSFLFLSPGTSLPSAALSWQGIVLQDWVEVIPNDTEETGLAFHYMNPGAEAPQVVLVVPPSKTGTAWKEADVWGTLAETFDLAKIRAVDREVLSAGQLLPALFTPLDLEGETAGTSWYSQLFKS